ncbi:hypothetical protein EYF80_067499 [Liparis tanakae]|uniref:Uncharacterized protein n=1 Tax=Liparis tanakae TaxID=230148 RepID=A0A4Z2E0P0_9TELE|nr:hypothetical protein EYF80_067499 [Liparis tanakae]
MLCMGASPPYSMSLTRAPLASSRSTTSAFAFLHAMCRGVCLSRSTACTSAPAASSVRHTRK